MKEQSKARSERTDGDDQSTVRVDLTACAVGAVLIEVCRAIQSSVGESCRVAEVNGS